MDLLGKSKYQKRRSSSDWVYAHLPFIMLIGVLGVLYIANSHYAEKQLRKLEEMKKKLELVKTEYVDIQTRMVRNTTPSVLIAETGLGEQVDLGNQVYLIK